MVSVHLDGRVLVAAGDTVYAEQFRVTDPIRDGLRVMVMLDGSTELRADDAATLSLTGPTSLAIVSEGETEREQTFLQGRPFRYVLVAVDRALVAGERGADPAEMLRASRGGCVTARIVLNARRSEPAADAVASQILACPEGRSHDLYRLSKALELTALVLDSFGGNGGDAKPARLTGAEAERIRAAREMLLASLSDPIDIATLASRVGLNLGKLSRGFRALYGATPYAVLQEQRLQAGYRMLSSGQRSVGQAAAATGYSQTHFATLFRRRFGLAPSHLLPKGNGSAD